MCSPREVREEEEDCTELTEDFIGRRSVGDGLAMRRTAGGELSSSGQPYECGEKVLRVGLDAVEGGRGPGRLLYVLDGEVRHRRRRPAGGECGFKSFKSKRRGRGVGWVPLDEGNGGGTGGASPPLPSGTGGRPTVVHDTVAHRGAAATTNRGGGGLSRDVVGWASTEEFQRKMSWAAKVNWVEMKG
jgi:hypothetical protein